MLVPILLLVMTGSSQSKPASTAATSPSLSSMLGLGSTASTSGVAAGAGTAALPMDFPRLSLPALGGTLTAGGGAGLLGATGLLGLAGVLGYYGFNYLSSEEPGMLSELNPGVYQLGPQSSSQFLYDYEEDPQNYPPYQTDYAYRQELEGYGYDQKLHPDHYGQIGEDYNALDIPTDYHESDSTKVFSTGYYLPGNGHPKKSKRNVKKNKEYMKTSTEKGEHKYVYVDLPETPKNTIQETYEPSIYNYAPMDGNQDYKYVYVDLPEAPKSAPPKNKEYEYVYVDLPKTPTADEYPAHDPHVYDYAPTEGKQNYKYVYVDLSGETSYDQRKSYRHETEQMKYKTKKEKESDNYKYVYVDLPNSADEQMKSKYAKDYYTENISQRAESRMSKDSLIIKNTNVNEAIDDIVISEEEKLLLMEYFEHLNRSQQY